MLQEILQGAGLYCNGCLDEVEVPREYIADPERLFEFRELARTLHSDCDKYHDVELAKQSIARKKQSLVGKLRLRDGFALNLPKPKRSDLR